MTLIEMMITLAVVGLLALVGYLGLRSVRKTALREDTTQLAAMLRAAHNMTTMTGTHHRVVIDLDAQTYRIERCEGEGRVELGQREPTREELEERLANAGRDQAFDSTGAREILNAVSPEEAAKISEALSGTRLGAARCELPTLPNGDADGRGNERAIRTDEELKIARVHVQHLDAPQLEGSVSINFFPMGYAEKALIEIVDDEGDQYTLLVHGLTGRVEFLDEEIDPDDHMLRDALGNRVEER